MPIEVDEKHLTEVVTSQMASPRKPKGSSSGSKTLVKSDLFADQSGENSEIINLAPSTRKRSDDFFIPSSGLGSGNGGQNKLPPKKNVPLLTANMFKLNFEEGNHHPFEILKGINSNVYKDKGSPVFVILIVFVLFLTFCF